MFSLTLLLRLVFGLGLETDKRPPQSVSPTPNWKWTDRSHHRSTAL